MLGLGVTQATQLRTHNKQQDSHTLKKGQQTTQLITDTEQQALLETGQTYTDSQCFPGVAKMFSTKEEALNSWDGVGVYTDTSFTG